METLINDEYVDRLIKEYYECLFNSNNSFDIVLSCYHVNKRDDVANIDANQSILEI